MLLDEIINYKYTFEDNFRLFLFHKIHPLRGINTGLTPGSHSRLEFVVKCPPVLGSSLLSARMCMGHPSSKMDDSFHKFLSLGRSFTKQHVDTWVSGSCSPISSEGISRSDQAQMCAMHHIHVDIERRSILYLFRQ